MYIWWSCSTHVRALTSNSNTERKKKEDREREIRGEREKRGKRGWGRRRASMTNFMKKSEEKSSTENHNSELLILFNQS